MRYDYIIQIIGSEKSGKTQLAHLIADCLESNGLSVEHCEFRKDNDYSELSDKNVLITEFRTNDDPIVKHSKKKENRFIEAFKKAFHNE